ncbi:MAG: tyrosine-type recombinase/integrase [Streptosporangiaceae bacterium]
MAAIRERNGHFAVTWREVADGRTIQRSATFKTMKEAKKAKQRAESGQPVERPEPEPVYRPERHGRTTLAGFHEQYLREHSYSDDGRIYAAGALKNYLLPFFGSVPLADVTPADVRRFVRKLEADGKSGALICKIKGVASALWMDAIDVDLADSNPWKGVRIKAHVARPKGVMTVEEYRAIVQAIHPHHRLLVRTLGETGVRWSEALRLVPADIIGTTLYVRESKNGKPREIAVTREMAEELRAGLPFTSVRGGSLEYNQFRLRHWMPVVEGLGWTIHDLRHFHATMLLAGGLDLVSARDRLGHSSIQVTSRYLHRTPDAGKKALAALEKALGAA